jgi:hypothetical protein
VLYVELQTDISGRHAGRIDEGEKRNFGLALDLYPVQTVVEVSDPNR